MFRRLRRSPEDSVEDVIAILEANYAFVGITERYELSRRALFHLLGKVPPSTQARKNRTESDEELDWRPLVDRIREVNRNDLRLYQHFCERFLGIERALEGFLADQ